MAISKVVCAEAASDKMKQVTPIELLVGKFSLLALDGVKVVGHVRTEGAIIGGLFVDPEYRGGGIAVKLIAEATESVLSEDLQPVAYCNETSVRAFEICDYTEAAPDKPNRTKMMYVSGAVYSHQELGGTLVSAGV